ncbi:MAG: LTA synthase family protein [Eubacterium sp.]
MKKYLLMLRDFFMEAYNKKTIITYIVISLIVNLILETLGRGTFYGGFVHMIKSPYVFLINSMIILMTLSFTLLARRRVFFISIISLMWIAFGIANCVLLSYRVTPFSATDLVMIENAIGIMNKYLNFFSYALIVLLAIGSVIGLVFIWIKIPKLDHKIKYFRNSLAIFLIFIIGFTSINIGLGSEILASNFGNLADAYKDYGFAYCFANSVFNTGVDKPSNYSEETIDKLLNEVSEDDNLDVNTPNVIIVQLESFFDIKKDEKLIFSEDPIPTFTELKNTCAHGYLNVPVIGAGTSNTEMEVLTGLNMDFFGPGEYPYKTILKSTTCESIAHNLKENGYSTHAIHNHTATFYSRNVVYSNLGFDTFTSIEYMKNIEYTPLDWAKDYVLTDEIMKCLKSTEEQDFVFTVSVQGHGSYPTSGDYDTTIEVTGDYSQSRLNAIEYYCTQIHEMDEFISELIRALSKYDEDTILVLYGDHLPSLGITAEELENSNIYQTEYVIWTNMDDIEYQSEDIEAFQLESKILEKLGITSGAINSYTQNSKYSEEYLNGLQNLTYDILYGDNLAYGGENPFKKTEIQYGIDKIDISSIEIIEGILPYEDEEEETSMETEASEDDKKSHTATDTVDDEGESQVAETYVQIKGNNFTKYSKVYVNGEKYKTELIDNETLWISYDEIKDGDSFVVTQQNSDKHQLSSTEPYIYESTNE